MSAAPAKSGKAAGNVVPMPRQPGAPRAPRSKGSTLPRALRTPPAWLSTTAKAEWRRVVPKLDEAFPDALLAPDVGALGLMFEHFSIAVSAAKSMRSGKRGGGDPVAVDTDEAHRDRLRKAPASQVMRDHAKAYVELARDFAMTLRARLGIDLEKLGGVVPDDGDDDDGLFDD